MEKSEVRAIAERAGLRLLEKDSAGMSCMVKKRTSSNFFEQHYHCPAKKREIWSLLMVRAKRTTCWLDVLYDWSTSRTLGIGGGGDSQEPWFVVRGKDHSDKHIICGARVPSSCIVCLAWMQVKSTFTTNEPMPKNSGVYSEIPLSSARRSCDSSLIG